MNQKPAHRVFLDPDGTWPSQWLAVIVSAPTGVVYQHQCAGVACLLREVQGFLVPLGGHKLDADEGMVDPTEFSGVFHKRRQCVWGSADNALPPERLTLLRQLVSTVPYWFAGVDNDTETREALALDDSRLEDVREAWVPVLTADGPGVLVWANCD